jgi:hypothetical protein
MPLNLVIRTSDSSFPKVMGNDRSNVHRKEWNELFRLPPLLRSKRYFAVQVSCQPIQYDTSSDKVNDSNNENDSDNGRIQRTFHGCCGAEFTRMIILREMNFVVCSDLWDLYVMSNQNYNWDASLSSVYKCLHMALVPHSDHVIVDECRKWKSWTYVRTCHACMLRMDLEAAIRQHLREHDTMSKNRAATSASFHWHIDVYMDSIFDESYKCVSAATLIPFVEQHPNFITDEQQKNVAEIHEDLLTLKINEEDGCGAIEHSKQTCEPIAQRMGQCSYHRQNQGRTKPRIKTRRRLREYKTNATKQKYGDIV